VISLIAVDMAGGSGGPAAGGLLMDANPVCGYWPKRSLNRRTLGQHYNGSDMPAGEAQRVWFPEMIEWLRSEWHPGMSLDAIIELRDGLDPMLQRIPSERHIRPPIFRCTQSGHVGEGTEPHISVRAMILSLSRFGIATAELTHALEKDWAAYRQGNGLDLYGRSLASLPTEASCLHPQVR
jgi:hypothetical protein